MFEREERNQKGFFLHSAPLREGLFLPEFDCFHFFQFLDDSRLCQHKSFVLGLALNARKLDHMLISDPAAPEATLFHFA